MLVRLMQVQMVSGTYRDRQDVVGPKAEFALLLAALLDRPGTAGGVPPVRKPAATVKQLHNTNAVQQIKIGPAAAKKQSGKTQPPAGGLESLVDRVAARHGLDPALLRAVVKAESDFDPTVVSGAGAMGLMQLMPDTAREIGVRDPFDPLQNLEGGALYLKKMLTRFNGDLNLALAAYNAGPSAVDQYGGVPPYRETMAYLRKIRRILGGKFRD